MPLKFGLNPLGVPFRRWQIWENKIKESVSAQPVHTPRSGLPGHCSPGNAGLWTDHLEKPFLLGMETGSGGAFLFSDGEAAQALFA